MKISKYNYIFYKNNQSYWMNGLTKNYFILPERIGHELQDLIHNPEILKVQLPHLYNQLKERGFIVSENINELQLLHDFQDEVINQSHYMLVILPTLNCNYNCWYCYQSHIPSVMSEETMSKILQHIEHAIKYRHITSLQIEWFGGEPFLQFNNILKPLGERIKSLCQENGILFMQTSTTNGHYVTPELTPILKDLNFKNFQITLDGDKEIHNKIKNQANCESTFDRVLCNISAILRECPEIIVTLRLNYDYTNFSTKIIEQVNGYIPDKLRERLFICPHKVWQKKPQPEKVEDLQKIWQGFKDAGYKFSHPMFIRDFESCYANRKNYAMINFNGEILKCVSDGNFTSPDSMRPGIINEDGSLQWKDGMDLRYTTPTGRSEMCTKCKYLPVCMGMCPKESLKGDPSCKIEDLDYTFEDAIINYIELCCL